jgi:hypothetical protein
MLAQSASAFSSIPATIAAWLACLFFTAALYNALSTAVRGMKDRPSPAEVQANSDKTFATRQQIDELEERIEDQRKASEVSRARLYHQIDEVRKELDTKIDGMPDRIIARLSNLGVLVRPGSGGNHP